MDLPLGEACGPPGGILLSFLLVWWGNLKQDFFQRACIAGLLCVVLCFFFEGHGRVFLLKRCLCDILFFDFQFAFFVDLTG